MKYYIISGEASGDLHGSNLMKALFKIDSKADIRFWGGDLMVAIGGTLVKHYKDLAFMGFLEVIRNIPTILKNIAFCKNDIENFKPDTIIFIDYSGFNLRIAKWAKRHNYRTNYYISPQVWASRASRINAIKRDIDKMHVILPFEKAFYNTHDYNVTFVGHPLVDAILNTPLVDSTSFKKEHQLIDKPIIALLPGSRKQEIAKMLKVMLSIVDDFPEYQFVIAGAPSQDFNFYKTFIGHKNIAFVSNRTYDLLSLSHAALVTSGTATLETALFKVPQVVCYKTSFLSYQIGKRIITLQFIALVNLIMNREIVTELIQKDLNTTRLKQELQRILTPEHRKQVFFDYFELEQQLGGGGASKRAAESIYKSLT